MKKIKKRHLIKQDGVRTRSYCTICQKFNCDSMAHNPNTPAAIKEQKRSLLGLCRGCGKDKCTCKSKESDKW